ncbi:MAG: YraN family protein [Magnetococcales bacterium]|nr:YraN family protein [Magnetococcales bacterium]
MTVWRKLLGDQGEKMASAYLEKHGYKILDRNIRSRSGEIDLIAMDGNTLVFCEVRTRGGRSLDQAAESIDVRKQQRLTRLAEEYLQKHQEFSDHDCRFDAVLLQKEQDRWTLSLIADAFRPGW